MNLDQLIKSLTNEEQQEPYQILQNKNSGEKFSLKLEETRFSTGLYCPRCSCIEPIVKCGQYKGKQRYACKSCGRIFTATSETFLSSTKKEISLWLKYIQCMIRKMSLRKTAAECQISLRTSFMWRHKILDALRKSQKSKLDGLIEADETFFRVSYKGSKPVDREPRRRQGHTSEVCPQIKSACPVPLSVVARLHLPRLEGWAKPAVRPWIRFSLTESRKTPSSARTKRSPTSDLPRKIC